MNKAKFYPWIFAVVFGIVGTIACMKVACIYQDLASKTMWDNVAKIGWREVHVINYERSSASANILRYLGILSFTIIFIAILVGIPVYLELSDVTNETLGSKIGKILFACLAASYFAYLFVEGLLRYWLWDYMRLGWDYRTSPITGTLFGSFIGTISGLAIGIIIGFMRKDFLGGLTISIIIFGILGSIVGRFFYNNGFIVSLSIVPAFASIGYAIGKPVAEKAEIAEIKRREEERRRKEYERIMKECKLKLKQWKEEGYDVSELEEMLK